VTNDRPSILVYGRELRTFDLHSSSNINQVTKSRTVSSASHVTCRGRSAMVGIPEDKRPLGTPQHRWDINVKIHCKEMEWKDVDSINLV